MIHLEVGDSASITRTFDRETVSSFLDLADAPPVDAVPEPLIGGLFSYLLGVKLPGNGTNYLKQEMQFHAAAPLDEPLTATVEVTRLRPEKALCDLRTECRTSTGALISSGRALVLTKDVAATPPWGSDSAADPRMADPLPA